MRALILCSLALVTVGSPALADYDFQRDWYETGVVGDGWGDAATTVGDINGDGYSDILIGSPQYDFFSNLSAGLVSLYRGSSTGPSSTPDWVFTAGVSFGQFGYTIAAAGDMNADGFDDFVVAAPFTSNGHSEEGRLYFFLGHASGLPVEAGWAEIDEEDAWLGFDVAYAGDVNGDGYDDVIAGAPGWGGFGSPFIVPVQGRAYVFHGGPNGPETTASWSRGGGDTNGEYGYAVAGLGDVNGDGFADVMVGKPGYDPGLLGTDHGQINVYYGSATGLESTPSWSYNGANVGDEWGRELSFAGDFNGDGYADALFGVPDYGGGVGAVYIASGGPSGLGAPALMTSGPSGSYGADVSTIGDFNGDGRSDFIVGGSVADDVWIYFGAGQPEFEYRIYGGGEYGEILGPAGDVNGDGFSDFLAVDPIEVSGAGACRLYFGGPETRSSLGPGALISGSAAEEYGDALASAGDVDGDGIDDMIVGSPGWSGVGKVYLHFGSTSSITGVADWTAIGAGPSGRFGDAVSTAGDINGDGYADIVVGDPDNDEIHVYHGGLGGLASTPDFSYQFPIAGSEFGFAVSGGGDINGDGFSDVAVGAPSYDDPISDAGLVRIFFGSMQGLDPANTFDRNGSSLTYGERLGQSLAFVGDTIGNGYDDLLVGAPNASTFSKSGVGQAYIYWGGPGGDQGSYSVWSGQTAGQHLGYAVAAAGDMDGNGYADYAIAEPFDDTAGTDAGRIFVQLGGGEGTVYMENPSTGTRFGQSMVGLGDPDGSGRSMIAVSRMSANATQTVINVLELDGSALVSRAGNVLNYSFEDIRLASAGDVDADGIAEFMWGFPQIASNDGLVCLHGPITVTAPLPPPPHAHARSTQGHPVGLGGRLDLGAQLEIDVVGWLPVGRTRLNLEWNVGEEFQPYTERGLGNWVPAVTHIGGTPLSTTTNVAWNNSARYRWRVRVLSSNPFVPHGRWLSPQPSVNTLTSLNVRNLTATSVNDVPTTPHATLGPAVPNPFNPRTEMSFELARAEMVSLRIYDPAGRLVRVLQDGRLQAGRHEIQWDGSDDRGVPAASGVYFAILRTPDQFLGRRKLTLIK